MRYTVLLLEPDHIAETFGQSTVLHNVEAASVPDAIEAAQLLAQQAADEGNHEAWYPLFVCEGDVENVRDQGIRKAQVPITESQVITLNTILGHVMQDGSYSEKILADVRDLRVKLRHAVLMED